MNFPPTWQSFLLALLLSLQSFIIILTIELQWAIPAGPAVPPGMRLHHTLYIEIIKNSMVNIGRKGEKMDTH